ncbi:MAG: AbrB/MazE/SpoVT family DNA-binding domain-containing protein [archaeon]
MKCYKCKKPMKYVNGMKFNEYTIDGWRCKCGETYYEPDQAQRILLLNKLKKEAIKAKLGKVRSNLILRLPKDIENALDLHKGEEVLLTIEDKGLKVVPA